MTIQSQSSISFGAIPIAKYKLPAGEQVRILELEQKDLPFIRKLTDNMEPFMDKREIESVTDKRLIIDASFNVIREMLERVKEIGQGKKTRMFIAECNSDICGVLVGGLPKKAPNGHLKFSSREGAKSDETELNWLATWTQNAATKRKGVGKILMSEYADTFERDGFKQAFIQSEIPSLSFAQKFYEKLGFKAMSQQVPHSQIEKNKDVVTCVENLYDYEIVPMLGETKEINKVKDEIFRAYERTVPQRDSIDLSENITL